MKKDDLRAMPEKELIVHLHSLKKESMNLRFRKASAELQNTSRMRFVKRSIARVNTIISEK